MKNRNWLKAIKKLSGGRLILAALLFLLSMALPPAVAQIGLPTLMVQTLTLSQQGRTLYEEGKFQEAARVWQQAADTFAAEGKMLSSAMALSNLSLTYQQLGRWDSAKEAIASSLEVLRKLESTPEQQRIKAQTLDIQGQLQLEVGQPEIALSTWQESEEIYLKINLEEAMARSQINIAQAMQDLGFYPRACKTLLKAFQETASQCKNLDEIPIPEAELPPSLKAKGLLSLGNVLLAMGNPEKSQEILEKARNLSPEYEGPVLLALGNVKRVLKETDAALQDYEEAAEKASSQIIQFQAQLNQLNLLIDEKGKDDDKKWEEDDKKWEEADKLSFQLQEKLHQLPLTHTAVYARVNLGRNLVCLKERQSKCFSKPTSLTLEDLEVIIDQLKAALTAAERLEDKRSQSYASGNLGWVYERLGEWDNAQKYTEEALELAQEVEGDDIAYQWYWQLGRLLREGDLQGAIFAYSQAVNSLQNLRSDLVTLSQDFQFDFRDEVEPVYRQYVDLLLREENPSQENLKKARQVIEALQLAELDNFFRAACVKANPQQIDLVDKTAAVVYAIIIENRLEIILSLSEQPLSHYTTELPDDFKGRLAGLPKLLQSGISKSQSFYLEEAPKIYKWLFPQKMEEKLKEFESKLKEANLIAKNGVPTLVFVLDNLLRNIPMAALYIDKEEYLVDRYAIAITSGLQVLNPKPFAEQFNILAAGLTAENNQDPPSLKGWSPLIAVKDELEAITEEGDKNQLLLGKQYTSDNIESKLNSSPYSIVHLATHGQFSAKLEDTFILDWDDIININRLNQMLQGKEKNNPEPIELLVLSACETAKGDEDNRAILGLAGIAVRSGASSTLATLWLVNDSSTAELMKKFYNELNTKGINKAQALRLAQLALKDEREPIRRWAPFVLVGSWL